MKNKSAHVFYSPALRYFVEVAEIGSIRGAARRLNVVSSAVNRQILNLEEQFGLKLFDRIGRGIKLSEAGEVLLVHAKRSLMDFDNALEALHDLSGLKRGLVKVAVVESVADTLMANVIAQFHQEYPGIEVDVQVSSSARVIKAIQSSQVHVAIGFNVEEKEALEVIAAKELEIGLAMSPTHPLAHHNSIGLEEAAKYPMTVPVESLSIGKIVADGLAAQNIKIDTLLKANSLKFMKLMAIEHQYIAFQTRLGIEREAEEKQLIFVPIDAPELKRDQLALVTNKMHDLSLAPQTFVDYLNKALKAFEPSL